MSFQIKDHNLLLSHPADLEDATVPSGTSYRLVHGRTPDYCFLHEPRLDVFGGRLVVNFSNAPVLESEPAQIMRMRTSADGGETWSPVKTMIEGFPDGHRRRETAPLLGQPDGLWAFVGRYDFGSKNSRGMEIFRLAPGGTQFEPVSEGFAVESFVPFVRPQRLQNGNWIMGGHINHVSQAAVAISIGSDLTNWRVVPIGYRQQLGFPETAIIVADGAVLALVRPEPGEPNADVAISFDHGESFGPLTQSNLPVVDTKLFSGTLSSGHHYVIFNQRNDLGAQQGETKRNCLAIGVMAPGRLGSFISVRTLIEGLPAEIAPQLQELGESGAVHAWAYPEAVEHEGTLYVVFSMNKRHCVLARVPVKSLISDWRPDDPALNVSATPSGRLRSTGSPRGTVVSLASVPSG